MGFERDFFLQEFSTRHERKKRREILIFLWVFRFVSIFFLSFSYYQSTLQYMYSIQYIYIYIYISFGYYMNVLLSCIRFPILYSYICISLYIYTILYCTCKYKFHLYSLHYYFLCFPLLSFSFIRTLAHFCQTKPKLLEIGSRRYLHLLAPQGNTQLRSINAPESESYFRAFVHQTTT